MLVSFERQIPTDSRGADTIKTGAEHKDCDSNRASGASGCCRAAHTKPTTHRPISQFGTQTLAERAATTVQGAGKTSLITAVATESFPDHPPPVLPHTRLPADATPEGVPMTIMDTSSRDEERAALEVGHPKALSPAAPTPAQHKTGLQIAMA